MIDDSPDRGDPGWRSALEPLRADAALPPGLEARVLASLRQARPRPDRPGVRWLRIALAGLLLLVAGAALGRWSGSPPEGRGGGPRFLLLLYEGPAYDSTGATHEQRVSEYQAWAGALARKGSLVDASELRPEEGRLGNLPDASQPGNGVVAGYFIVRAASQAQALAIAATCPHLKYGGGVSVRRLTDS
jgi:hypothetical protein